MTVPPSTAARFAIVPLSPGPAPADAIITGSMSAVMEYIPQSIARADAVEELEQARFTADQIASLQEKTRAVQASMLADFVNHLAARLDALVARRDEEARERAKAEEEAEAQRIQDELNALPDPDDPTTFEEDRHIPGGELHTLPAKDEEEFEEPDPDEPSDDMGGVPISYSYVRGGLKDAAASKDQAEFEEPADPTGTVIPQPTAVEFDGG